MTTIFAPVYAKANGFQHAYAVRTTQYGNHYLSPTKPLAHDDLGWLFQKVIESRDGRRTLTETWFRTKKSADKWYQLWDQVKEDI